MEEKIGAFYDINYRSYLRRLYSRNRWYRISIVCDKLKNCRHHIINGIRLSKLYYYALSKRRSASACMPTIMVLTLWQWPKGAQFGESVKCSWDEWKMNTQNLMFIDGKTQTPEKKTKRMRMWTKKKQITRHEHAHSSSSPSIFRFLQKSNFWTETQCLSKLTSGLTQNNHLKTNQSCS